MFYIDRKFVMVKVNVLVENVNVQMAVMKEKPVIYSNR